MRAEHRKNRRRYVMQAARIGLADGSMLGDCRVIDMSGAGARLEFKNIDTVPDQFELLLSYDGHLRRQCSVVWRSETAIGVEFIQST
jgi:PilZ domain